MTETEGEQQETTGLEDYLRVVRERWWVVAVSVIVVTAAAFYFSFATTPLYSASSNRPQNHAVLG